MFKTTVPSDGSLYTYPVERFVPRFSDWQVVEVKGRVFELPPFTLDKAIELLINKVLTTKAQPYYRNLMRLELKPRRTKDGKRNGVYRVGKKLLRVSDTPIAKPSIFLSQSVNEPPMSVSRMVCGKVGVFVKGSDSSYVISTDRPLLDHSTFFKYVLVYPHYVGITYVSGKKCTSKNILSDWSKHTNMCKDLAITKGGSLVELSGVLVS